jgi:hypothetical protein
MSASLLLLVPAVLFATVGVVVLVVLTLTARPDHTLASEVASARRHGLATSVAAGIGYVAVIAFLIWLATRPSDGYVRPTPAWLGALPLIGSVAAITILALGELTWPRPRALKREVNLNPRTTSDLLPRVWRRVLAAFSSLTLVVVGLGWWAADPSGHTITVHHPAERLTHTGGPFPGVDYGLPQLVAAALVMLLLGAVLRLAVLRPAVVRSDVATDNRLRSASAVRAVRVAVSGLALTSAGNLFVGGTAGIRVFDPGWQQTLSAGAMLLAAAVGVVGILVVLVPAPRLPKAAPTSPSEARASSPA